MRRVVDRVCWRSDTRRLLRRWATACLWWAGPYLVLVLVSRLAGLIADVFSPASALVVPGLALLSALVTHHRTTPEEGARMIDRRAEAHDLFLTALRLQPKGDAFQPLVARQAEEAAATVNVARIVPWAWEARHGHALAAVAALVLIAAFTPQWDPFERRAVAQQVNERARKLEESRMATAMRAQELEQRNPEERSEAVNRALTKLEHTFQAARPELQEQTRRELSERQGEMGGLWRQLSEEKLRDALDKSRAAQRFGTQSPLRRQFREFAQEGRFGDLSKAMESIREQLKEQAAKPDSAGRREAMGELQDQMQALAEALAETLGSENLNNALSRALEQMDMSNMQDLAQKAMEALQESMSLSQEELENLAKALQDMKNLEAGLSAAQLAKALNELGKLSGEGMDGAEGMSDYEKLYREMMAGQVQGQGLAQGGQSGQGAGEGTGGEGQGRGGKAPENDDAETAFMTERSQSAMREGKLLMNIRSNGSAEMGQVENAYREALGALREAASEAILQEQVPPGYHEAIRDYFDRMDAPGGN